MCDSFRYIYSTCIADSDDTSLEIEFISNDTIDLDQKQTSVVIRAVIGNYDPSGGYFYSKITDPRGNIINNSEIFPKYWKNELWHIITGYSVNKYDYQNQYDVFGSWSITIYNESGAVSQSVLFSVIGSDALKNTTMENGPNLTKSVTRESMKEKENKELSKNNNNSNPKNIKTKQSKATKPDTSWWITSEDKATKPDTSWWITSESKIVKSTTNCGIAIENNSDIQVNDNSSSSPNTSQNVPLITKKDTTIPQPKNTWIDSVFLLDSHIALAIILIVFFVFVILIILKKYKKKISAPKISKYVWFKILPKPQVFEDDIFAEKLENLKEFGLIICKKEEIKIFVMVLPDDSHHITSLKGLTAEMLKGPPDIQFDTAAATTLKLKLPFRYPLTVEKKKCKIYDTSTEVSDFVIGINGISCDPAKIKKSAEKHINSKSEDKGWKSGVSAIKKKAEAEKFFSCEIFYAGDVLSEVKSVINFTGDTSPNSLVDGRKRDIKKILESTPRATFFGKPCILSIVEISSIIGFPDDARDIPVEYGVDDTHVSESAVVHNLDDNFEYTKK